jgi:diphosphomevalonate decarboxylase
MGKRDAMSNLPENGSISVTLEDLCTLASLEESGEGSGLRFSNELPDFAATWKPRHEAPGCELLKPLSPPLSPAGSSKVLKHIERVFESCEALLPSFGLKTRSVHGRSFTLRTANTFPQASGIASSASAFAAVTLVSAQARAEHPAQFADLFKTDLNLKRALARLSRRGSGSSCRSFEGPWVEWEDERAFAHDFRTPTLAHFVVVVSADAKEVSSSEAHAMIKTSPLWAGRVERVGVRLKALRHALSKGELHSISQIAWADSWEMHSLFHTAERPFTYWQPGSVRVLRALKPLVEGMQTANPVVTPIVTPIVTMDAGPNVHILVPEEQREAFRKQLLILFSDLRILEDGEGRGAVLK